MNTNKDSIEFINNISTKEIDNIISKYPNEKNRLLSILLDIQDITDKHYVPAEAVDYLAEKLNLKTTNIYDVITFFSALSITPRSKYPIQVCSSIACKVNDNQSLMDNLKSILNIDINEATSDGKFSLEIVPCFGACDVAPAVRINGKVYGQLTSKSKIEEVLNNFI